VIKKTEPFLVNFLILVPFILLLIWGKKGILINKKKLIILIAFGIGFGFVEAANIIFLRGASNFLYNRESCLLNNTSIINSECEQAFLVQKIPPKFYRVEFIREIATIIMLISIGLIAGKSFAERFIFFLWVFAIWDIAYYIFLRLIAGWPWSLLSYDFLFLVPLPWYGQVWYPLLVSLLTIATIIYISIKRKN